MAHMRMTKGKKIFEKKRKAKKDECEYGATSNGAKVFTGTGEVSRLMRNSVIGGDSPFGRL